LSTFCFSQEGLQSGWIGSVWPDQCFGRTALGDGINDDVARLEVTCGAGDKVGVAGNGTQPGSPLGGVQLNRAGGVIPDNGRLSMIKGGHNFRATHPILAGIHPTCMYRCSQLPPGGPCNQSPWTFFWRPTIHQQQSSEWPTRARASFSPELYHSKQF